MADDVARCSLCGEPMPEGEEMFKIHGYSGPCPKPHRPPSESELLARAVMEAASTFQLPSDGDVRVILKSFGTDERLSFMRGVLYARSVLGKK